MRILVVEDEAEMAELLSRGLRGEGHVVDVAPDGVAAISISSSLTYEVAVVDVGLPGMSGFELCRRLKDEHPATAVILLTARDSVDDRVRGLDVGADDYLTKPFAFAELAARIRAVRRRDLLAGSRVLTVGGIVIDLPRHRVDVDGRPVSISSTEFDVLRVLADAKGEVVSRRRLLEEVWGTTDIDPNVVDQYISYLRRKIATPRARAAIVTTRGVGYTLVAAP